MAMDEAEYAPSSPSAGDMCAYVEEMAMDLAAMASRVGESSLAASLALVGIQAAAAKRRHGEGVSLAPLVRPEEARRGLPG